MRASRWVPDADVDLVVQRVNPLDGTRLNDELLSSTLDEAGVLILRHAAGQRRRRRLPGLRFPGRLPLLGVMLLIVFGGVAAASGLFCERPYPYVQPRLAASRRWPGGEPQPGRHGLVQVVVHELRRNLVPGELRRVEGLRDEEVGPTPCPSGSAPGCKVFMNTGMINAGIARSAFAAWVLDCRHAKLTGNVNGARQAAAVIAKAPRWKATTDPGPYGAQYFGWMKSFVRAVAAGSVSEVDRLIATEAGAYFPYYDPSFQAWWRAHPRLNPSPAYLAFLERGRP